MNIYKLNENKIMLIFNVIFLVLVYRIKCKTLEPTFHHKAKDSQIYVFDAFTKYGDIIQRLLATNKSYSYFYPDPYSNPERKANDGNLHWSASISPKLLIKTKFWGALRSCMNNIPNELTGGKRYLPYFTQGTMLRRGDFATTFKGDPNHADSIFARIFLSGNLKKNSYADQTFYDEDEEILTSIHPKKGRLILWKGNISTLMRPPSMEYEQAEFSLLLKLNPKKELFYEALKKYEEYIVQSDTHANTPLPFNNQMKNFSINELDLSKHLLGKYRDVDGNVIAFFDNILPKTVLDDLRRYMTEYHRGFSYNPYDADSAETHDNVKWVINHKIEKLLQTPIYEAIKVLGASITNETFEWFPYDVSTNLIQHSHHTRIHIDCVHKEYELTFLLYLNPNWDENKYAETSFYNYVNNGPEGEEVDVGGKADEEYDFVAAAIPKFGRIAIFRNIIPHSARPPSPNFPAARYTLPVKVAKSEGYARAKMLAEKLDIIDGVLKDPLYEALQDGDYETVLKQPGSLSWIDEHYKKVTDVIQRSEKDRVKKLEFILVSETFRKT